MNDPSGERLAEYVVAVYIGPGVQLIGQAFAADTAAVCVPVGVITSQRLSVLKVGYEKYDVALSDLAIASGVITVTLSKSTARGDTAPDVHLDLGYDPPSLDESTGFSGDTIVLPEASYSVKRRARLTDNNDSTRYLASELRDSTDRTVADVLAKVPGMQLGENGELAYRGNKVSRVLVDGSDVFGEGGYADPIRRLGAGLIAEVTAIERFHDDAVLSMIEPSNETVIDLISTEDYRGTFAGDAPVAAGVATNGDPRYQVGLAGTYLAKQRSLYVDLDAQRLDRLSGTRTSTFILESSPEPIGRLSNEFPSMRTARVSVNTALAPAALIGDAETWQASINYHHRLPSGNRVVARLSYAGADDVLAGSTRLRARGAENLGIEYDVFERREASLRPSPWTADLAYKGTSETRDRTWHFVGLARQSRDGFSDRLGLEDPSGGNPLGRFPLRSSGQRLAGSIGGRVNQRLGTGVAMQAFFEVGASTIRENARLRIAGRFTLDTSRILAAGDSVAQTSGVDYAFLRTGGKAFVRLGAALLDIQLVGALHRYDSRTTLGRVDTASNGFDAQSTYRTAKLSTGASLALNAQWRARASLGAEAIAGPFVGRDDASVFVASYDLSAERVAGKRPALTLAARRQVTLPRPASRLGLPQLTNPLSLARELTAATAQVQELLAAQWHRSYTNGKGNAVAEVAYVWRQRELSEVYDLEGPTRQLKSGQVLTGSSVSVQAFGDQQMIKMQSVLEWSTSGSRQRQDANLAGVVGRYTRTEVSGEVRYYWLRNARVLPRIELSAGYSEVGGAIRARTGYVAEALGARIRVNGLYITPSVTLNHYLVEQEWDRAYLNGALELGYPIGRRDEQFPANLTVSIRNLFAQSTARASSFDAPFLLTIETVAAPMSIWVGYRIPVKTGSKAARDK